MDLPPQPAAWFRNLSALSWETTPGFTWPPRMALRSPAFSHCAISMCWSTNMAAQIHESNHLGGHATPALAGHPRQLRTLGSPKFDLGRSECDNPGLIKFKGRWGATRSTLSYVRFPFRRSQIASTATQAPIVKYLFAHVPDSLLAAAGRVLYKHVG